MVADVEKVEYLNEERSIWSDSQATLRIAKVLKGECRGTDRIGELLLQSHHVPEANELSTRTALWAIENMQGSEGYLDFQIQRGYRNRIPYMRWSQAWMF